jgi:hypothetical protein
VTGELADPDHLLVETRVEDLALTLFDYELRNDGVIELDLDRRVAHVGQLRLRGEGTQLAVEGNVDLRGQTIDVTATGDANLGILQGFFRDLRTSGSASLAAGVSGTIEKPEFSGTRDGDGRRIRHFLMPRSLDDMNGVVSFDAGGVRLDNVDGDARRRERRVHRPHSARRLHARRAEHHGHGGADADELSRRASVPRSMPTSRLRGTIQSPLLTGSVTVRDAVYERRFETTPNSVRLRWGRRCRSGRAVGRPAIPLRFDVQIDAPPGSLRIANNIARLQAQADLRLQGTYDRPLLSGRADIDRGVVDFEGNRYEITRGTIDFVNPAAIEPYFDIEAETRVRIAEQTYRVTLGFLGTTRRFAPTITSDPPLPTGRRHCAALRAGPESSPTPNSARSARRRRSRVRPTCSRGLASRLLTSPFWRPSARSPKRSSEAVPPCSSRRASARRVTRSRRRRDWSSASVCPAAPT